jgi:threonine/homoserine/homoserine lactone efflux protein
MFEVFLKGAAIGFSMSILFIGPSFFALIQTSIKNGFRSAVAMAAGISVSDIFLVLCAYFGVERFLENPRNKIYEGFVGSAILLVFGIVALFQKHEDEKDAQKGYAAAASQSNKLPLMFAKGFVLNLLNPFVLLVWVGWLTTVSHYSSKEDIAAMMIGTLGTVFAGDVLKSLVANRIRAFITHTLLKWIHYIMAIALIVSGIILLYDVLTGHGGAA